VGERIWGDDTYRGGKKLMYGEENLSTKNLTSTDVESIPGFRSDRPVNKRLSLGTVWMCADGS